MSQKKGGFTLPGESGYEKLTLELAEKWGADVIRDSDGTTLSDEIVNAGYGIYSTICIIRDHNEWAKKNTDKLQQTFLSTAPVVAVSASTTIELMKDFFAEQFRINDTDAAFKYWQVYDRTTEEEVDKKSWKYEKSNGTVSIETIPYHKYTVSFLAYRIWEEISMYNHTTNNWEKEHLMQIDPRYEETRIYLKEWLVKWCEEHPATTVVRFTSLFYNFVWIWGSDERNRHLYSDWASYDFTVSEKALDDFKNKYGYSLTAEDFINKGDLHVTHMPGNKKKKDWMEFINDFVIKTAKELIDIVHSYGKKAYVFLDDSWIGLEPTNERFKEFGFDGLIKCVFSGFEVRLCAKTAVPTHEIRLHPYLFPVGLGGLPTFAEGGDPATDAKRYWINIRRALLRAKIDRIGLGGYLHLVQGFPDFVDTIENISDEFRNIVEMHCKGTPYTEKTKVAVLHYWGNLRPWTLSGHFHETYMHELIHVNEALSGLPVDVSFIDFEDVKNGKINDYDVIINAGRMGSAWSGGDAWKDEKVVTELTKWVYEGGTFVGIGEPSAVEGYDRTFRMSHVLGVDEDLGSKVCHGKWNFKVADEYGIVPEGTNIAPKNNIFLADGDTKVLQSKDGIPTITLKTCGKGNGIYISSFEVNHVNTRLLHNVIRFAGNEGSDMFITDNIHTECALFEESNTLVVINNSETVQKTAIFTKKEKVEVELQPFETRFIRIA